MAAQRQHAHDLLDQLDPGQLEAIVKLLEVMISGDDDDIMSEEDWRAVAASREYFRQNPQGGIPFQDMVAECGFTMDEVREGTDEQ